MLKQCLLLSKIQETFRPRANLSLMAIPSLRANSHGVPSPTHVSKFQLLSLKKPIKCGVHLSKSNLDYFMQYNLGTHVESRA